MPSLYIVLEKKIPGGDASNGNFLSKHNNELEKMAKRLGVKPLMSFFSTSKEEVGSLLGEDAGSLDIDIAEKWFAAEEGLRTVNALLNDLSASKLKDAARVEADLLEFIAVLELAKANGVRWHLAVDY